MRDFSSIFLLSISCLIPLCSENIRCMTSVILNLFRCVLCRRMCFILVSIPCKIEKNMYPAVVLTHLDSLCLLRDLTPLLSCKALFLSLVIFFVLKSAYFLITIATPATVWLRHTWCIFLHTFIFPLSESLHSKWVFTWILFCFSNLVFHALSYNFVLKQKLESIC